MRVFVSLLIFLFIIGHLSRAQSPVKVIFDTDMGSDCDDVGALAYLHALADLGKVEILGCIYSSGKVPYGAGIIQAINGYYGRGDIPVGAYHAREVGDSVDKMDAKRLASDTSLYGHSIILNSQAEALTTVVRSLLANSSKQEVVYITVGHTKGLYDVLVSTPDDLSSWTGEELIKHKVSQWVALGALKADQRSGAKDWNFFFNGTAPYTKYLVENFPRPIYYVSAGTDVMTGSSLVNLSQGVIVRDAYESWLSWYGNKSLQDQRPSWDLACVYYAVEGEGKYLKNLGRGNLDFDPENGCSWHPGQESEPEQYYIIQKPGISQNFADYLNQMISKKPKFNSQTH